MAWNKRSLFWPDCNSLKLRKLFYGLTGMALCGKCWFGFDWNDLEWRKLVVA
jgi:hypothetical protein